MLAILEVIEFSYVAMVSIYSFLFQILKEKVDFYITMGDINQSFITG